MRRLCLRTKPAAVAHTGKLLASTFGSSCGILGPSLLRLSKQKQQPPQKGGKKAVGSQKSDDSQHPVFTIPIKDQTESVHKLRSDHAAVLDSAEGCRIKYLADRGYTLDTFNELSMRPFVLEDRLTYQKEIVTTIPHRVELKLLASTSDGRRMAIRNSVVREEDGAVCAVVESAFVYLDNETEKPVVPPSELKSTWLALPKTEDFFWLSDDE